MKWPSTRSEPEKNTDGSAIDVEGLAIEFATASRAVSNVAERSMEGHRSRENAGKHETYVRDVG